jgi:hypothetical protein
MYVNELQPHYTFTDVSGIPWRYGTIIMLDRFPQHCGFLDYDKNGEQILLHKSKDYGPIITGPEGFVDCPVTYRVWVPIPCSSVPVSIASMGIPIRRPSGSTNASPSTFTPQICGAEFPFLRNRAIPKSRRR